MANISVDFENVSRISSEIQSIDSALVNNYFNELDSLLNNFVRILNQDSTARYVVTVESGLNELKDSINNVLKRLEEFLNDQLSQYGNVMQIVKERLMSILNEMQHLDMMGVPQFSYFDKVRTDSEFAKTHQSLPSSDSKEFDEIFGMLFPDQYGKN